MNGATIPLDSRGIPWSGFIPYNDDYDPVLPAATGFTIERVTPSGRSAVGVELELLTGPLVGDNGFSNPLLLVKPRGGFSAHAQYVFIDHGGHSPGFRGDGEPVRVVVNVSDRRLADGLDASSADLVAAEQTQAELRVMTTGGSCSVTVDAAQIALELRFRGDLTQWRDVLLFSTSVDGKLWHPRPSLCSKVAQGESWTGRGTDLVFATCTTPRYGKPSFQLEEGSHEVVVTAWWPGVASISGTTQVVLSCAEATIADRLPAR